MKTSKIFLAALCALGLSSTAFAQSTPTSTSGNMQSGSGTTTSGTMNQGSGMTRPSQSGSMSNGTMNDGTMQGGTVGNGAMGGGHTSGMKSSTKRNGKAKMKSSGSSASPGM